MNEHLLHKEALQRVREYRTSEKLLIEILEQIDEQKAFAKLGFGSLWSYVTQGLKLSESEAGRFISVMRKSRTIPELKSAIRNGELSVSKAARVISVIEPQTAETWIKKAETLSFREIEKEVAAEKPAKAKEKTKYLSANTIEVKAVLAEAGERALKRAQDILSKKQGKSLTLGEVIEKLANLYLEKSDPLQQPIKPRFLSNPKALPTWVARAVVQRDQAQCTEINPDGSRCPEKRFTDIHHIKPKCHGGTDTPENLTVLCHHHHTQKHPWARGVTTQSAG